MKGVERVLRVTVVEDDPGDCALIAGFLERYGRENGVELETAAYHSAVDFLEEYRGNADILLLDVELPGTDGMTAAREVRARDDRVAIVFITHMAQYAIDGYAVEACDFMVKPIRYPGFAAKLKRAAEWADRRRGHHVLLSDGAEFKRVRTTAILWLEKDRNYLIWHTRNGEFRERGTIGDALEKLRASGAGESFAECCTGFVVNLEHVEAIGKDTLTIGGQTLPVSRRMRKEFLHAYAAWG